VNLGIFLGKRQTFGVKMLPSHLKYTIFYFKGHWVYISLFNFARAIENALGY
jgi:hypothetical protein